MSNNSQNMSKVNTTEKLLLFRIYSKRVCTTDKKKCSTNLLNGKKILTNANFHETGPIHMHSGAINMYPNTWVAQNKLAACGSMAFNFIGWGTHIQAVFITHCVRNRERLAQRLSVSGVECFYSYAGIWATAMRRRSRCIKYVAILHGEMPEQERKRDGLSEQTKGKAQKNCEAT